MGYEREKMLIIDSNYVGSFSCSGQKNRFFNGLRARALFHILVWRLPMATATNSA